MRPLGIGRRVHLQAQLQAAALAEVAAGPLFTRHAKTGEAFGRADRDVAGQIVACGGGRCGPVADRVAGGEVQIAVQPPEFVRGHFPNIYEKLIGLDIDITKEPIPVVPAQHYTCGGIVVDRDGRTDSRRRAAALASVAARMGAGTAPRLLVPPAAQRRRSSKWRPRVFLRGGQS